MCRITSWVCTFIHLVNYYMHFVNPCAYIKFGILKISCNVVGQLIYIQKLHFVNWNLPSWFPWNNNITFALIDSAYYLTLKKICVIGEHVWKMGVVLNFRDFNILIMIDLTFSLQELIGGSLKERYIVILKKPLQNCRGS